MTFAVVVAGMYWGREVLVPVALAVFIAFLLAPVVRRLERLLRWRVPTVLVTMTATTLLVGSVGWVVEQQLVELTDRLPEYKANIVAKVRSLRPAFSGILGKPNDLFSELGQELINKPEAPAAGAKADERDKPAEPTPVKVIAEPTPPLTYLQNLLGPMLSRLATVGVAIVLAAFMLVYREDIRSRLIRLTGERRMHVTTPALDDAAQRVTRYLVMQSVSNAASGLVIGAGMHFLGVPNAALWGLVVAILKFVPYVGVWIAVALPLVLSLAVSPGWAQPISVFALVMAVELCSANIVEPLMLSSGTGLSPLAVLGSAIFWAWLWGPVGLVLSTPMAVCLAVLGRHVPGLRFFEIVLGDKPVLTRESQLYQRVLAGDHDESRAILHAAVKENPDGVFDGLLIPALRLAEAHRDQGSLDETQEAVVMDTLETMVDEAQPAAEGLGGTAEETGAVLCIAASDRADELAANMVERILGRLGVRARTISSDAMIGEIIEEVVKADPAAVCISALPPGSVVHARVLSKRLRARCPSLAIVVGIWDASVDEQSARREFGTAVTDYVVTTVTQAAAKLRSVAGREPAASPAG